MFHVPYTNLLFTPHTSGRLFTRSHHEHARESPRGNRAIPATSSLSLELSDEMSIFLTTSRRFGHKANNSTPHTRTCLDCLQHKQLANARGLGVTTESLQTQIIEKRGNTRFVPRRGGVRQNGQLKPRRLGTHCRLQVIVLIPSRENLPDLRLNTKVRN